MCNNEYYLSPGLVFGGGERFVIVFVVADGLIREHAVIGPKKVEQQLCVRATNVKLQRPTACCYPASLAWLGRAHLAGLPLNIIQRRGNGSRK